jgi:hypothetical protein
MVVAAIVLVRGRGVAGVCVRSGVVSIGASAVSVVFLPGALLVMQRHALSPGDRGRALDRNGQREQQHSDKAAETFRHRRAL